MDRAHRLRGGDRELIRALQPELCARNYLQLYPYRSAICIGIRRDRWAVPRGTNSTCESDGDDSDGQGTYQGGEGVRSTPPLAPGSGNFAGV